jgi:DNA-binding response OmpR family regulator/tetratricopeptide (TPR) repeat protein
MMTAPMVLPVFWVQLLMMKKRILLFALLSLVGLLVSPRIQAQSAAKATVGKEAGATPEEMVDSLLAIYLKAAKSQRPVLARKIVDVCLADDQLTEPLRQRLGDGPASSLGSLPKDTVNFLVHFAADRFYISCGRFEDALRHCEAALRISPPEKNTSGRKGDPMLQATLLCDRGYSLFKLSRNTEATEAEMQAEQFSRRHNLLQPLARSYNYMAIIDLSLGYIDEAKHFVQKAIDTDRQTGSDLNTHNYLGIACEVYNVAKEPEKAISYGRQAVEAARRIGYDAGVVNHLSQLSYAYNRAGNLEHALEMSRQAVATVEQMAVVDRNLLAISLEYVAFNLLDMKRNSEAVPVIRRAIALQQEVGNMRSVCYDHKSLAEALEPDSPREALAALRRYSAMMDSLHYDEMHNVLGKANAQLHNDELSDENDHQRRENRIILIASLLVGLLALAVIAALVYAIRTRNRSMRAMQRLQAARDEFYANMTHQFRTPLTVILGVADQLDLPVITRNANQLLQLVNQLLDVAMKKSEVGPADGARRIRSGAMLLRDGVKGAMSQGDGSKRKHQGTRDVLPGAEGLALVVEDNPDVAAYIGSVLEPDFEVVFAADGQEGVYKAEALVPDVIVTDVMMPTMDGLELCRRIRANIITDHIPVVVVTARVTDADRLRGIAAGADAYLTKPFLADELRLRIAKLLEQRRRLLAKAGATAVDGSLSVADHAEKEREKQLSEASKEFLKKLNEVILGQMAKGDVSTKTVAAELFMSSSQLVRKLHALTGITPSAYILEQRMQEALRLLAHTPKYTIAEIAIHCAFSDTSHFSRTFRRRFGIPPSQYVSD